MRLEHSLPPDAQHQNTRPATPVGRQRMPDIDFSLPDVSLPQSPVAAQEETVQPVAPQMVPQQSSDQIMESLFGPSPAGENPPASKASSVNPTQIQKQVKAQMEAQQQALMQAQARANLRAQAQAARTAQQQGGKPAEPASPETKEFEKPAAPGLDEAAQEPTGKKDRKRPGRKSKAQEEKERAAREKEEVQPEPQGRQEQQAEPTLPESGRPASITDVPVSPLSAEPAELPQPRLNVPLPVVPSERPEIKSARDVASFLSEPIAEPKPEPPAPEPPQELSTYEQLQMGQHRFVNPIETQIKPKFAEPEPRAPEPAKQQAYANIDWTTPADELGGTPREQAPWSTADGTVISQVPDQLWQQLSSVQEPVEPREPDVVYQRDFREPTVPPEWNTTGQRPQPQLSESELKEFLKTPAQPGHLMTPSQRVNAEQTGYPSDPSGYPQTPPDQANHGYPQSPQGYPQALQGYPATPAQQIPPQPLEQPRQPDEQPQQPQQPQVQPPQQVPQQMPAAQYQQPQELPQPQPAYEVYQPQPQEYINEPYTDLYANQYSNDPNSGVQFVDQYADQNDQYNYGQNQAPANSVPCLQCSAPMEIGARFCGECGYKVEIKIRGCHLCGAPLDETAKFCGECGSKLVESTGAVTISPVQQQMPNIVDPRTMQQQQPQQHYPPGDEKPSQRGWVNKLIKFLDE